MAAHSAPTSWAEDLKQYRSVRGCLSYSIISSGSDVPNRFARTSLVPFADTQHPRYSYQDPVLNSHEVTTAERYKRHGKKLFDEFLGFNCICQGSLSLG